MATKMSAAHRKRIFPNIWHFPPLVAYPPFLVVMRDPLCAVFDIRRCVQPAAFLFPHEEQLPATAFAFVFVAGFALLFVSVERLKFITFGTILAAALYSIFSHVCIRPYVYLNRASQADVSLVGLGCVMFLAAGCAIIVSAAS